MIPTIEEMNRLFERIQHAQTEQKQFMPMRHMNSERLSPP